MNNFFSKLLNLNNDHNTDEKQDENISPLQSEANDDSNAASDTDGTDDTDRYISALLALLADFYGTDKSSKTGNGSGQYVNQKFHTIRTYTGEFGRLLTRTDGFQISTEPGEGKADKTD